MSGLEVAAQFYPLIPAKAGIQGIIYKPKQATPWIPTYVGMSGSEVCSQLNPLIPAKAGIQGIICKPKRARPWIPTYVGMSGLEVAAQFHPLIPAKAGIQRIIPTVCGPVAGSRTAQDRAEMKFNQFQLCR